MNESENIVKNGIRILQDEGILEFIRHLVNYMLTLLQEGVDKFSFVLFPYILFRIKTFKQYHDLNKIITFTSKELLGVIEHLQIREEILSLLKRLEQEKLEVILEIGTARGGTLYMFSTIASDDATIISIDLPKGKFGGGYPKWKKPLFKAFARGNQTIHLIRADSHSKSTFEDVKEFLDGKSVDFLFIDGDHTYNGIKCDFEMYITLVKPGGIIAFHDIVPGSERAVGGVPEFWSEFKGHYKYDEIVNNWDQGAYGIGVIYL